MLDTEGGVIGCSNSREAISSQEGCTQEPVFVEAEGRINIAYVVKNESVDNGGRKEPRIR
jgi:hypothetical protein